MNTNEAVDVRAGSARVAIARLVDESLGAGGFVACLL